MGCARIQLTKRKGHPRQEKKERVRCGGEIMGLRAAVPEIYILQARQQRPAPATRSPTPQKTFFPPPPTPPRTPPTLALLTRLSLYQFDQLAQHLIADDKGGGRLYIRGTTGAKHTPTTKPLRRHTLRTTQHYAPQNQNPPSPQSPSLHTCSDHHRTPVTHVLRHTLAPPQTTHRQCDIRPATAPTQT